MYPNAKQTNLSMCHHAGCRDKEDEFYHVFRNLKVQWIGTGELGAVFFYPVDEPPLDDKRVTRVWFSPEVRDITTCGILDCCDF